MERLATGATFDRPFVRVAAAAFGCFTLFLVAWGFAGRTGTLDEWGRPLGTDFSGIYAAGRMANEGRAAAIFDLHAHRAAQEAVHAASEPPGKGEGEPALPFFPWHYPPVFLLLAAPLAALPYLPALILWQVASLAAVLATLRAILPDRDTLLLAAGAPVVFVCLAHGQNGFLTAALFGGGLSLLERRPVLAGALLGCLCYKPHLALVVPLALVAGGYWRALLASAASAAGLFALSALAFGPDTWWAFAQSLPQTRRLTLEEGATGWYKLASVYGYARNVGLPLTAASVAQAFVSVVALAGTAVLWWRQVSSSLRNAALLAGALLATPYLLDYDLVLLGPAIAFLVAHGLRHGFRRWEQALLAYAWLVPIAGRHLAFFAGLPASAGAVVAVFALALTRGLADVRERTPTAPASGYGSAMDRRRSGQPDTGNGYA